MHPSLNERKNFFLFQWIALFRSIFQIFPSLQLEPLGVNTELDKTKLVQSKKASERKAVKKAYEEVWSTLLGPFYFLNSTFFVAFVCRENLRRGIIPYVSHFWSSSIVLQWTHFSFSGNPSQMPGYRRNCWPCSGWSCIFKIITFCLDTSFICFDRSTKDKRLGRKEHQRYEYLLCFEPWNRKFRFWSFFIMVKLKRWRQEIPSENGIGHLCKFMVKIVLVFGR